MPTTWPATAATLATATETETAATSAVAAAAATWKTIAAAITRTSKCQHFAQREYFVVAVFLGDQSQSSSSNNNSETWQHQSFCICMQQTVASATTITISIVNSGPKIITIFIGNFNIIPLSYQLICPFFIKYIFLLAIYLGNDP